MLKNISNLGNPLTTAEKQLINGGVVPGSGWDEQYCFEEDQPEYCNKSNKYPSARGDGTSGTGDE